MTLPRVSKYSLSPRNSARCPVRKTRHSFEGNGKFPITTE
jgi:hypothetical protein